VGCRHRTGAARRGRGGVVEVGALRGETTVRMLDDPGPDASSTSSTPAPQFDPAEPERAFPGRYQVHRGLSLEVFPTWDPSTPR
jgi:hypothetical protein